jgi:hypothetical protein
MSTGPPSQSSGEVERAQKPILLIQSHYSLLNNKYLLSLILISLLYIVYLLHTQ